MAWREASWADLRVNLLAVALGLVLVGLGVILGRWARGRLTALVMVARQGMATGGKRALGQVAASLRKATSVRKGPARRRAAGGSPRDAGVNHVDAGVARSLPRPRVKPIIAEFERSFGWRGVRARISRAPVAPVRVTLWVPGVPSPAMALLARAIEAEWAAAGQSLHIRLMAAAEG